MNGGNSFSTTPLKKNDPPHRIESRPSSDQSRASIDVSFAVIAAHIRDFADLFRRAGLSHPISERSFAALLFRPRDDLDHPAFVFIRHLSLRPSIGLNRGLPTSGALVSRLSASFTAYAASLCRSAAVNEAPAKSRATMRFECRTTCGLATAPVANASATSVMSSPAARRWRAFGEARDLYRAHQIVDQLEDGAGADRRRNAGWQCGSERVRARTFQIGSVSADEQRQFSGGRCLRQAGDRTVDVTQASRGQVAGQIARVLKRDRRTFDGQCIRLCSRGCAILAEPHGTRSIVIGNHRHDRIGITRSVGWRTGPARAARDQVISFGSAPIPERDGETVIEIAPRHAMPHTSKTNECDVGHDVVPGC